MEVTDTSNGFIERPQNVHVSHLNFHFPLIFCFDVSETTFTFKNTDGPGKGISERQPNCILAWLRLRLVF